MIKGAKNKKSEYTKKALEQSLFMLMEKEPFHSISILEICQHAEVSRAAFYRNFDTKEDIIEYTLQKKIHHSQEHKKADKETLLFDYDSFISLWIDEKEFLRLIFQNNLTLLFIKHFNEFLRGYMLDIKAFDDDYIDYFSTNLAYSTAALLDVWIQHDCRENAEDFVALFDRLYDTWIHRKF